jgi:hypothetical protein
VLELRQLKRKTIRPSKRLVITGDTIAVAITAMATLIMATGTTGHMGTTGHTVITAMAGDQVSPSVSDLAGAGVTKGEKKPPMSQGFWIQTIIRFGGDGGTGGPTRTIQITSSSIPKVARVRPVN